MSTFLTLYVPRDSAALAVGADEVAAALQALAERDGVALNLIRNGSRGLLWLETLVEVVTPQGRVAFGPVEPDDVEALWPALRAESEGMVADVVEGAASTHPLRQGLTEQIDYLSRQQRLSFARVGVTDPLSLADYEAAGGWAGLRAAQALAREQSPAAVVQAVLDSGLRGRGGAAFPAGIKWRTVAAAPVNSPAAQRYVVCNADEGDSGTFADRMLMEGDPYLLIEGMAIAALAVGATRGYIYVRSEYPQAVVVLEEAIRRAREAGKLGAQASFELEVRMGAGSYVCGEETALLESLEGRRGVVRAKPPLPAIQGLFGQPTIVNNVLTFAAVPQILALGAAHYRSFGVGRSTGTLAFQLAGNVRRGGLIELPFGHTLRQLIEDFGGGTRSGRPVKAVQVGGPLGAYVPPSGWDVPLDYEAYAAMGAVLGHGGIVVHDDTADLSKLARHAMAFCAAESCGKCTPCRIGSTRGVEVIDRIRLQRDQPTQREAQITLLRDLCDTMLHGSLCAMGGMTPYPVLSALDHYPADFAADLGQRLKGAAT